MTTNGLLLVIFGTGIMFWASLNSAKKKPDPAPAHSSRASRPDTDSAPMPRPAAHSGRWVASTDPMGRVTVRELPSGVGSMQNAGHGGPAQPEPKYRTALDRPAYR